MIPILYGPNETEFKDNGLGRLRDCIRCEVTEERNGIYEIEFTYPVNGQHFDEIQCGCIIMAEHDETGDLQPFDIYAYDLPIDGVATFHGQHISYRQRTITASGTGVSTLSQAFSILSSGLPGNPFSYSSDITTNAVATSFDGTPRSVREYLGGVEGSILQAFGGEYEWDRFMVKLWKARGQKRNFTIRYGVNLLDYHEEMDFSESYNAVIPYWAGEDTIVKGDIQLAGKPSYNGRTLCVPLDVTDKFESQPTKSQVETAGRSYMEANQTHLPLNNITIDFIKLNDSDEYDSFSDIQKFSLCDSVNVVLPMYNIFGTYKIVKVVWDVLSERYTEMELGNLSTTLSEALGI